MVSLTYDIKSKQTNHDPKSYQNMGPDSDPRPLLDPDFSFSIVSMSPKVWLPALFTGRGNWGHMAASLPTLNLSLLSNTFPSYLYPCALRSRSSKGFASKSSLDVCGMEASSRRITPLLMSSRTRSLWALLHKVWFHP